jgi:hypothetical protein
VLVRSHYPSVILVKYINKQVSINRYKFLEVYSLTLCSRKAGWEEEEKRKRNGRRGCTILHPVLAVQDWLNCYIVYLLSPLGTEC